MASLVLLLLSDVPGKFFLLIQYLCTYLHIQVPVLGVIKDQIIYIAFFVRCVKNI